MTRRLQLRNARPFQLKRGGEEGDIRHSLISETKGTGLFWNERMELIKKFLDLLLHLDKHLDGLIQSYGPWIYVIFFVVIFCETGLVVTPILPGDSLLFAIGVFAARPDG